MDIWWQEKRRIPKANTKIRAGLEKEKEAKMTEEKGKRQKVIFQ